jgi:hypothetical protein
MKQKFLHLGVGLFTLLIGLVLAGLWSERGRFQQGPSYPVVSRSTEEDRIAEALFRHLLQEHQGLKVCFLSRDGADPSDDFLRRFQGEVPVKKKGSLRTRGRYRQILDKETGAISGIVSVGPIKWISDSEVEVGGGFYDGEVIEYRYRMCHTSLGWIIRSSEFVMES